MKSFKSETGTVVTDEMMEQWADDCERGEYPGAEGPSTQYMGMPPTNAELSALREVSIRLSPDLLRILDARARREGVTRDDVVKAALIREFAGA